MAKTAKQHAADLALDRALARVLREYKLLPVDPDVLDYMRAIQEVANGIVLGALDALGEAADVGSVGHGPDSSGRAGG